MKYHEESDKILTTLNDNLKRSFDGCESILELKKANFQWKQMEWIGWYMEYKVRTILVEKLGGEEGPKYGNTSFDYILTYPWDIKAHIENSSSHPWVILNDCEAIANALQEYGRLGYIIISGHAIYDSDGSFKNWHENLKGKKSQYVMERIKRGAPSRKRKKSFNLCKIYILWLTEEILEKGLNEKWIGFFQENMRNADGTARRAKYKLKVTEYEE